MKWDKKYWISIGYIEPIDMSLVDSMTDIDISIVANNINVEKKED